jgi:hypothetical protein
MGQPPGRDFFLLTGLYHSHAKTMGTATRSIGHAGTRGFGAIARRASSKYFYLLMSLLVMAAVVYGFSFTVEDNLIHPTVPRPWVL